MLTDPHIGNFGIAVPQLEQFDENDLSEYFANPEIIPVIPRDPSFPLVSLPQYVTPRVSIADFLRSEKALLVEPGGSIKLFDFGRGAVVVRRVELMHG